MFNFLKRKKDPETPENQNSTPAASNKEGFFRRLSHGLKKTRTNLATGFENLLSGKKVIDASVIDEIESILLTADVGYAVTEQIIKELTSLLARKQLNDASVIIEILQNHLHHVLKPCEQALVINNTKEKPFVILMVGVNGVGKTTTIGKLAKRLQAEGKKVMLAAGDTFRAAAVEQLKVWGERNNIAVIAQHTGADSASVIFDALKAAQTRGVDVLIADTAGRLHTKENLMQELQKVKRVLAKLDEHAPHETMLVLDAGNGQNALSQAEHFNTAIKLNSITLTKLDGTAKGGIIFAIAKKLALPIRYIGVGEGIDDLRPFVADDFVQALFVDETVGEKDVSSERK